MIMYVEIMILFPVLSGESVPPTVMNGYDPLLYDIYEIPCTYAQSMTKAVFIS